MTERYKPYDVRRITSGYEALFRERDGYYTSSVSVGVRSDRAGLWIHWSSDTKVLLLDFGVLCFYLTIYLTKR